MDLKATPTRSDFDCIALNFLSLPIGSSFAPLPVYETDVAREGKVVFVAIKPRKGLRNPTGLGEILLHSVKKTTMLVFDRHAEDPKFLSTMTVYTADYFTHNGS
jgi:hypothetical protein